MGRLVKVLCMFMYVCVYLLIWLALFHFFICLKRENNVISWFLKREYEFEKLERTCQKIYFQLAPSTLRTCAEGPGAVIKGVCT